MFLYLRHLSYFFNQNTRNSCSGFQASYFVGGLTATLHALYLQLREPKATQKKQQKVTPPGTCHERRGLSRKARRACRPEPCRPPARGTPFPAESRKVHTAYLKKYTRAAPYSTAPTMHRQSARTSGGLDHGRHLLFYNNCVILELKESFIL